MRRGTVIFSLSEHRPHGRVRNEGLEGGSFGAPLRFTRIARWAEGIVFQGCPVVITRPIPA